ncbi:MAG: aminoacyl-histidine dipeptidase [Candidatus Aminicenantes bacterium]|nr:aminoacyl-histidine dipeptidase [Candidatus Aminicenantes bacterium]
MSEVLAGLKPESLWKHFGRILEIPHCSGREKALGDYVIGEAKRLNLDWKRDEAGNIVVSKPASPGRDRAETVILQGHLDMVCEKNSDVQHDFGKQPIIAELKNGWVQARGTTLGSDNGIGLAAALAVMESGSLVHGPLEFLFTVDEETGLTGARKIQPGFLKGTRMMNLDSEELGTFTIGCAGGADTEITLPLRRQPAGKQGRYLLKVLGFRGGHSGIDIHLGRANALKLLARLLAELEENMPFRLAVFEGGNKHNAIPREAWAEILLPESRAGEAESVLKESFDKIKVEYQVVEKDAAWSFAKSKSRGPQPLAPSSQRSLIGLLLALPHGVLAMHPEIAGLVETSNNVAIVRLKPARAQITCSSRSSIASALRAVRLNIKVICRMAGAKAHQPEGYPGWMPDLNSPMLKALQDVHVRVFGKPAVVGAIHAGLECGLIGEKFPGMDMISFGPTIQHPHSPEERVYVESVDGFFTFLVQALSALS